MRREKLSDILAGKSGEQLVKAWHAARPAQDYGPLPAGEYLAHIMDGQAKRSPQGTPGYRLTFRVAEGEFTGRLFWHTMPFTEKAMPLTVRDMERLGVEDFKELDNPLPKYMRCRVRLDCVLDRDDYPRNRVRDFKVIGRDAVDPGEPDAPGGGPAV